MEAAMHSRGRVAFSLAPTVLVRLLAITLYIVALVVGALPASSSLWCSVVAGALLLVEVALGGLWQYFGHCEVSWRLDRLRRHLLSTGLCYGEVREPPSQAIRLSRVHRDGQWRLLPTNLLVAQDIVQVSPGERECSVPAAQRMGDSAEYGSNLWRVTETVLDAQLNRALSSRTDRQDRWRNGFALIDGLLGAILILACLAAILGHYWSSLRLFPLPAILAAVIRSVPVPSIMLAAIILSSPIWTGTLSLLGSARLLALVEVLQKSKTPYMAAEDDDEFDEEAPPPMKDVVLRLVDVATIIRRSIPLDRGHAPSCLLWTFDLVSALSSVSVLSFLNREGPISSVCFPQRSPLFIEH